MSDLITTGPNFNFIQDSFIDAKIDLMKEVETGVIEPDRLKGVGLSGASRTGKSWDICVFVCHYVTSYKGKQINICRDFFANITDTIYLTLKNVWYLYGLPLNGNFHKRATPIHFNGNIINFIGINDNIMKAHGLESDLLIINEAMGVEFASAKQLMQRTKEFFIFDYNPSAVESWLFDLDNRPSYKSLHTTIFDNKYAPANAKQELLLSAHPEVDDFHIAEKAGYSVKDWTELKERNVLLGSANAFHWQVYGLGLKSVSEDVIFNNWTLYNDGNFPPSVDYHHYGGDFGYSTDPCTLIHYAKSGNNIYLRECFYETGLLNSMIAQKQIANGWNDQISIWDSAELKSIDELIVNGINATYAIKGPGSIMWGIQSLQGVKIHIHEDSLNLQREFKKYRWAKDRQGNFKRDAHGRRMPFDKDNHTIDAVRYAHTYYLTPSNE